MTTFLSVGQFLCSVFRKEHPDIDEVEDFKALKLHDDKVTITAIAAAASTLGNYFVTTLEIKWMEK